MTYKVLAADMPSLTTVVPYLEDIHSSGHFSNFGKLEYVYRTEMASKLNVAPEQIATCSNATLGIQGICSILDLPIFKVQNFTFPATGLAVQNSGKPLELVDVALDSWVMENDFDETGKISSVPFGKSIDDFRYFEKGFHIVDAAASLGNMNDLSVLKANHAVVFSLHATKILGCGEGGLVVFGDKDLAAQFRSWTNFGFNGNRISEIRSSTNAKLSELSCAYALASLAEFPAKLNMYHILRAKVNEISRNLGVLPKVLNSDFVSPYWIIQLKTQEIRDDVEIELGKQGIETRRWWPKPLSQMPAFASSSNLSSAEVNSLSLTTTTLGLPFHLKLAIHDFDEIGVFLGEILRKHE